MHQLIASYLFQNKECPLPGFGTLSVLNNGATADFTNQLISAPKAYIHFENRESNEAGLLKFIAAKTYMSDNESTAALDQFCFHLKNEISEHATVNLAGIGNFFVDNNGNMIFRQKELPQVYSASVYAERVIHPHAAHNMLVGDRETTNMLMKEYYSEETEIKDRWWVWAIVLGVVSILIILLFLTLTGGSSTGNAVKI